MDPLIRVDLVDDEIRRQVQSMEGLEDLTGLTAEVMRRDSDNFVETIDNILRDDLNPRLSGPFRIPDSLPAVVDQTVVTPSTTGIGSSTLSMSSILRMSIRARSIQRQAASKNAMAAAEQKLICTPLTTKMAQSTTTDLLVGSSPRAGDETLALFELSGTSIPPTNQLSLMNGCGATMETVGFSFGTCTNTGETGVQGGSGCLLVQATQFPGDPIAFGTLLPDTPTHTKADQCASQATDVEAPPTQYNPASTQIKPSSSTAEMSQIDLFAVSSTITGGSVVIPCTNSSGVILEEDTPLCTPTLTEPSLPTADNEEEEEAVRASYGSDEEEEIGRFSGHETVILPDSFDEEENPFTLPRDAQDSTDPVPKITKINDDEFESDNDQRNETEKENHNGQQPKGNWSVPRTGKRVRFAPTPVDSSQPPAPMTVTMVSRHPRRTDTQEMEESFASSLSKLCRQVITVARKEIESPGDLDDRIQKEDEEIVRSRPRTPLTIKSASKGATPIQMARIIQAISTPTTPKSKQPLTKKPKLAPSSPTKSIIRSEPTMMLELQEGMLVWANWRPNYYTPAWTVQKKSKSRDVWQVRLAHRQSSSTPVYLSSDHLVPFCLLKTGDPILHITDRRRYRTVRYTYHHHHEDGDGSMMVYLGEKGDIGLGLGELVLDRQMFLEKHRLWKSCKVSPPPHDDQQQDEPAYTLTPKGLSSLNSSSYTEGESQLLFKSLEFVLTGIADKPALTQKILDNGGRIVEEPRPGTILIGSQCKTTTKYFSSVILGLDRVKPSWIDACLAHGTRLSPSPQHCLDPSIPSGTRQNLFADVWLCFVGVKAFKESCESIALLAGCPLIISDQRRLNNIQDRSVMVVMERLEALKPRLQAVCLANGHLITDKAWFTGSILAGHLLPS